MPDLQAHIRCIDAILAGSTTLDRTLLDQAFSALSGLEIEGNDKKLGRKLERILEAYNEVGAQYPDVFDPSKPLPATALVSYAYLLQQIRMLGRE